MNPFQIFAIEARQSRAYFLGTLIVALVMGFLVNVSSQAGARIREMTNPVEWNADMVILPKGVSLEQFRRDLLQGNSSGLLPLALFETTQEIAKAKFKLGAVLALTEDGAPKILTAGDSLGLGWLKNKKVIQNWKEQSIYATPEWGNHVVSGIFAAGPLPLLRSLKDLIDRKSVGQAYWIQDQLNEGRRLQEQLEGPLQVFLLSSGTVALLFFWLSTISIRARLKNCFLVFSELGWPKGFQVKLQSVVILLTFILPAGLGFLLGSLIQI